MMERVNIENSFALRGMIIVLVQSMKINLHILAKDRYPSK